MILKTLFLFLFFNLSSHGIEHKLELKEREIILPKDLSGLAGNETHRKFTLKYKIYKKKLPIQQKKHSLTNTIKKFLETLIFSYVNKNKKLLKSLVNPSDINFFDSNNDNSKIEGVFNLLSQAESPRLELVYEYAGGLVLWWNANNFVQARQVFIKKIDNQYKLSKFHIGKDDFLYTNINLFLQFKAFEKFTARAIPSSIKIIGEETKEFKFSLVREGSYLSLFKDGDSEVFVHTIDNYFSSNIRFSDHDPKKKAITLKFNGKNFRGAGNRKVYFIESTYPIGKLTRNHFKSSPYIMVNKVNSKD